MAVFLLAFKRVLIVECTHSAVSTRVARELERDLLEWRDSRRRQINARCKMGKIRAVSPSGWCYEFRNKTMVAAHPLLVSRADCLGFQRDLFRNWPCVRYNNRHACHRGWATVPINRKTFINTNKIARTNTKYQNTGWNFWRWGCRILTNDIDARMSPSL